jgi:predicted house-cleaning noncanonical NTP pyrophosphatase (MazG superfamily)
MTRKISSIDQKIESIVEKKVNEIMREILSDPDFRLEFTEKFIKRIKESIKSKKKGEVVDLDKVLQRYNLKLL